MCKFLRKYRVRFVTNVEIKKKTENALVHCDPLTRHTHIPNTRCLRAPDEISDQ
jgi:hypothetical protein